MAKELTIIGDRERTFPDIEEPLAITRALVRGCRYEDWSGLSRLTNLVSLDVVEWLGLDFEPLRALRNLEQLRMHHLPNVTSLDPLSELSSLRRLVLETTPGWDSSGKVTEVVSLAPLRGLPLEELNMFGVRPVSKSVDDLLEISSLRKVRLSKFAAKEIKRINAKVPNEWVDWHEPSWGVWAAADAITVGPCFPPGIRSERLESTPHGYERSSSSQAHVGECDRPGSGIVGRIPAWQARLSSVTIAGRHGP